MVVHILHAGLGHPSPFFYNFIPCLEKYKDVKIVVSPDLPVNKEKNGIVYFHRLKRYYDSQNLQSAKDFIDKVNAIKANGWKIAWTIHNFFPIDRNISEVDEYVIKEFLKKIDKVFTFTKYMQKKLYKNYNKKAIVHSIGINDLDGWFDSTKFSKKIPNDAFVFTFVGNMSKYKMLDSIVENFNKLKKENCYLLLAGPFKENSYDKYADKNIIIFNSFVGNENWKLICEITNVFINIYDLEYKNFRYGFFPSNCIQIAKNKKIAITPKSEIFDELIPKKAMINYDFNEDNGLLNAMKFAYNNREKIRKIEKNIGIEKYDWNKTASIIINEFRELLNENKN